MFADDTSIFSVVHNIDSSAAELDNGLAKISHWLHQWKMSFNPDSSRQAHEFISGRKFNKDSHPPLTFNNNIVHQGASHKHLVIILDNRLSFEEQRTLVFTIINKTIGLIRKLLQTFRSDTMSYPKICTSYYAQNFCHTSSWFWWHYIWKNL